MNLLIKSAKLIDSRSEFNGMVKDIFIKDGLISEIGDSLKIKDAEIFDASGKCISIGWFDLHANFCDPGEEFKEDILSGIAAAAAGGFTGVALSADTHPAIQGKSQVEYVLNKSKNKAVDIFPVGALSMNLEGKDIAEMYDMKLAGAVAFSDDKKSINDSGLLLRAMLYAKNIDTLIMAFSEDKNLTGKSQVNESANTTLLGFKGQPSIAEDIIVERNIRLCEYADTHLHLSCISTAKSVELIKNAKARGVKVTCDVAAHYLMLDDSMLATYDSNYKVKPFLRSRENVDALIEGIVAGTIDAVCSDHTPQDIESKMVEFDFASFGIVALESMFGVLNTVLKDKISIEKIVQLITINPRNILSQTNPSFSKGNKANFTIFDPEAKWTFSDKDIKSKSRNTPFIGKEFIGKPVAITNNGILV